jgi:sigma54-dependent transcription regulator
MTKALHRIVACICVMIGMHGWRPSTCICTQLSIVYLFRVLNLLHTRTKLRSLYSNHRVRIRVIPTLRYVASYSTALE